MTANWNEQVRLELLESAETKRFIGQNHVEPIVRGTKLIVDSFRAGGKLLLCGNGGSAADCQHIAGEFVGRLSNTYLRAPMPAISLTVNTSNLTALGNDYGFAEVFARQLDAIGKKGDVLMAISTSGNSENILNAVIRAKLLGIATVGLLGRSGKLKDAVDVAIAVPSDNTQRIQEAHITIGHIICHLVEQAVNS